MDNIEDSLFNYVQFPGQSAVNKKEDLEYSQVNDPTECAAKCNNELKIHCRSFNYCPNNKACYLSTKHSVDSLSSGLNEDFVCTHYSSKYTLQRVPYDVDKLFEKLKETSCQTLSTQPRPKLT